MTQRTEGRGEKMAMERSRRSGRVVRRKTEGRRGKDARRQKVVSTCGMRRVFVVCGVRCAWSECPCCVCGVFYVFCVTGTGITAAIAPRVHSN